MEYKKAPVVKTPSTSKIATLGAENNAKIKMGESVVVFGAGGIGLNIIQAAAMVSGNPIIAVDIHDPKSLIRLVYVEDVIDSFIKIIDQKIITDLSKCDD